MLTTCETVWARICHFTWNISHYSTQCPSYSEFWKIHVLKKKGWRKTSDPSLDGKNVSPSSPGSSNFLPAPPPLKTLDVYCSLWSCPRKQHDRPHYWRRQNMENHPWPLPLNSLTKALRYTKFTSLTSFYGIHLFPFPRLPLKFRPPQCTRPLEVIFYLVSSIHTSLPTLYTGQLFFNSNLSLWILCLKLFHKDAQHHSLSEKCKSKPQWCTITHQSEWLLSKSLQAINAGEGVEKREPSYTVGGNAN